MSKNIIIKKDGEAQTLNGVAKITTNEVDGGMCTWLPEDELGTVEIDTNGSYDAEDYGLVGFAQVTVNVPEHQAILGDLHADKNGTYNASSDGYDAYDSVYVNVTSISATMPDGNEYVLELEPDPDDPPDPDVPGSGTWIMPQDENGNVVVKKIPSKIKIDTVPSKTVYRTGETVYLTGGVIKAYDANDALFTNEDYPTGVIPNSELEVAPLTVSYDAAVEGGGTIVHQDGTYIEVKANEPIKIFNYNFDGRPHDYYLLSTVDCRLMIEEANGKYWFFGVKKTSGGLGSINRDAPAQSIPTGSQYTFNSYTHEGDTYYICGFAFSPSVSNVNEMYIDLEPYDLGAYYSESVAIERTYGTNAGTEYGGVKQTEEVTWICPYTDKPMKDSYEIVILKPDNSSDDNWSESSGGQHF